MNLVLDTNTYSSLQRGNKKVAELLSQAEIVYLPVIVIGELKRGFYYGSRVPQNITMLDNFIAKPRTKILDITDETAESYAILATYLKEQGTPIPINDVWIAALCLQYDLPLLTFDEDFKNLPQINLL